MREQASKGPEDQDSLRHTDAQGKEPSTVGHVVKPDMAVIMMEAGVRTRVPAYTSPDEDDPELVVVHVPSKTRKNQNEIDAFHSEVERLTDVVTKVDEARAETTKVRGQGNIPDAGQTLTLLDVHVIKGQAAAHIGIPTSPVEGRPYKTVHLPYTNQNLIRTYHVEVARLMNLVERVDAARANMAKAKTSASRP